MDWFEDLDKYLMTVIILVIIGILVMVISMVIVFLINMDIIQLSGSRQTYEISQLFQGISRLGQGVLGIGLFLGFRRLSEKLDFHKRFDLVNYTFLVFVSLQIVVSFFMMRTRLLYDVLPGRFSIIIFFQYSVGSSIELGLLFVMILFIFIRSITAEEVLFKTSHLPKNSENTEMTVSETVDEVEKENLIQVEFFQLRKEVPPVWTTDKELEISISTREFYEEDRLKIFIDDELVKDVGELEGNKINLKHHFEKKGEHELMIKQENDSSGEKEKKIVKMVIDGHKNRIVAEYTGLLRRLEEKGFDIKESYTPSEVKEELSMYVEDTSILNDIKDIIEKARYSQGEIGKEDFESIVDNIDKLEENLKK